MWFKMICPKTCDFNSELKHAEKQLLRISRYYGPFVWVKCLPYIQAIVMYVDHDRGNRFSIVPL